MHKSKVLCLFSAVAFVGCSSMPRAADEVSMRSPSSLSGFTVEIVPPIDSSKPNSPTKKSTYAVASDPFSIPPFGNSSWNCKTFGYRKGANGEEMSIVCKYGADEKARISQSTVCVFNPQTGNAASFWLWDGAAPIAQITLYCPR